MAYWNSGVVLTGLLLAGLLFVASVTIRVGGLGRLGVPASIMAGLLGLLLGPDVLGLLAFDRKTLEAIVYHGLAVVFIAVALQSPPAGARGAGATSIAFAIATMAAMQGLIGLVVVLLIGGLHPGLGLLVPYGWEEGPGQALSVGSAWELMGLADGGQIGLIYAAGGILWSCVFGIPLLAYGRARGWVAPPAPRSSPTGTVAAARREEGLLELLTAQIVAIGVIYLVTWGVIRFAVAALSLAPDDAAMVWGFHFIIGSVIAFPVRAYLAGRPADNPLDDDMLARISGTAVDVVACAGLAAVEIAVLRAHLGPIVIVSVLVGLATTWLALWLGRRAFPQEPFEHALVLFGMATGTLPVGLALLRMIDPEMRGTVPNSCVMGSAGAIVTSGPLFLFVLAIPVKQWPDGHPTAGWVTVGLLAAYLVGLFALWRLFGPLRFGRPLTALWPTIPR